MTALVVLRPEPGATATAARAAAAGWDVVKAPIFHVLPVAWTPPDDPVDGLLMTSANAARQGGPDLARYTALPLIAVGAGTAAAARTAGFADVRTGGGDLAALAPMLAGAGRLLHLAGREHRGAVPAGTMRRIVYASDAVETLAGEAVAALDAGGIALLHSPRAAVTFASLIDRAGLDRHGPSIAAFSPAVADAVTGWGRVAVAARPDDDALLAALAEWR